MVIYALITGTALPSIEKDTFFLLHWPSLEVEELTNLCKECGLASAKAPMGGLAEIGLLANITDLMEHHGI